MRAATMTRSAWIPRVMKVFAPFSFQPPDTRIADVLIARRSEPVPGSDIAIAIAVRPETMPGTHRVCCSAEAMSRK